MLRCYLQHGRAAIPVNPREASIEGQPCAPSLSGIVGEGGELAVSVITPPSKCFFFWGVWVRRVSNVLGEGRGVSCGVVLGAATHLTTTGIYMDIHQPIIQIDPTHTPPQNTTPHHTTQHNTQR